MAPSYSSPADLRGPHSWAESRGEHKEWKDFGCPTSFNFKIQLLPDGTRQSYVLIGEGLGRNPGLTAGAGTSVVYHSAWLGANCLL